MNSSPPTRLRTWLQLVRAPNLFTVPGDPLAGYLMANSYFIDWTLALVIVASLCFYAAGLLMNDLADEAEDRRERPNRPLPSGAVSRKSVIVVMVALCVIGLGVLALSGNPRAVGAGGGLIVAIALYNFVTKHWPVVGALNMGICRGLSVALGGFVGPIATKGMTTFAVVVIGLYIAAVTNLARHETRDRVPVVARLLPLLAMLLACFGGISFDFNGPATVPAAFIFALAGVMTLWLCVKLFRHPQPLPPLIGAHIRILLPLQAAICYTGSPPGEPFAGEPWSAGRLCAILLLCAWPLSKAVSRRFYAS